MREANFKFALFALQGLNLKNYLFQSFMLSNVNPFLNFEKLFLKKFVNITFILS